MNALNFIGWSWVRNLFAVVLLSMSIPVWAAPISYQIQGSGSGTVGSSAFSSATFIITGFGDSANLFSIGSGVFVTPLESLSVNLSGLGQSNAVNASFWYLNQAVPGVGFIDVLDGDIFDVEALRFASYDGVSSLETISVLAVFLAPFMTDAGLLSFDVVSDVTFTALSVANAAPEPSAGALFTIGLLLLAGACYRTRRRTVGYHKF